MNTSTIHPAQNKTPLISSKETVYSWIIFVVVLGIWILFQIRGIKKNLKLKREGQIAEIWSNVVLYAALHGVPIFIVWKLYSIGWWKNSAGLSLQGFSNLFAIYVFIMFFWFLIGKLIMLMGSKNNNEPSNIAHIRGAGKAHAKNLSDELNKITDEKSIQITPDIKIPRNLETTHFFIIGRPGCGKSQLLYRIIQKVLGRGDKAIIYDFKGDLVSKFYDPKNHILFNPFDKRCIKWNLFNEIETPLDIRSIAGSLIPESTGNDPYWSNAARDVFCGILTALYQSGKKTNADIHQCCIMPVSELQKFLSQYKGTETATRHLSQENTSSSILSVMASATHYFEYLQGMDGDFSIKRWASDDTDKRTVFLSNYSEIADTIRPVLSLFVDLAGKRVLSMPDNLDRRFFFFIDEFGTLNHLPTIPVMLTNGRSKGMSIWLAVQDMGQMERIYKKDLCQTIVNACASSFFFSVNDHNTADFISKKIGEREIKRTMVSNTESERNSTTTSYQFNKEYLYLGSEIQELPALEFLLKMSDYQIARLRLDIVKIEDRNPSFEIRDDLKLETVSPMVSDDSRGVVEIAKPEKKKRESLFDESLFK